MTRAYRSEQREPNLYNTMNNVQEKMLRGGVYVTNKQTGNKQRARAVASISENVRLNKALWTLTEKMAELKN